MKTKLLTPLFLAIGLLSACTNINPQPTDMDYLAMQSETKADHQALAEHYQKAAEDMQAKANEDKKLLSQYESKSYLYGRQAEDLKASCQRLIDVYEKAAKENLSMAKMHRQMM
ncbi:MAG: hypothetical protein ACXV79_11335 [Methylobacter sp.]